MGLGVVCYHQPRTSATATVVTTIQLMTACTATDAAPEVKYIVPVKSAIPGAGLAGSTAATVSDGAVTRGTTSPTEYRENDRRDTHSRELALSSSASPGVCSYDVLPAQSQTKCKVSENHAQKGKKLGGPKTVLVVDLLEHHLDCR